MSAVVMKAENEYNTVAWLKDIIADLDQHQITHLHFHKLKDAKKELVCRRIAGLPLRCFTVMSHKKNMRNHTNLSAEKAKVNRTAWFFCWLSRLLLERVTGYCAQRSARDYGETRTLRVEFSDRGGVNIEDVKLYYKYLLDQSQSNTLYLNLYDLSWSVVDFDQIAIYPNKMRAGLQLADSVASAFSHAVERTREGIVRPEYAKLLLPRVCLRPNARGRRYGYGLKMMPTWIPSLLPVDQREIIDFYG